MWFFPSIWGFLIFLIPLVIGTLGVWFEQAEDIWWMSLIIIGVLFILDLLVTPKRKRWKAKRRLSKVESQGRKFSVKIDILQDSGLDMLAWVKDTIPDEFEYIGREIITTNVASRKETKAGYKTISFKRGLFEFGPLILRYRSRLRLLNLQVRFKEKDSIKIYPDISIIKESPFATRKNLALEIGLKKMKFRGTGSEFKNLREYIPGDEIRKIDWKASARKNKPITKVYDLEKNNDVIFALDTGRLMQSKIDKLTKLDHAVNAAVMGSYISLQAEDRVGIVSFGRNVDNFIPPTKGEKQISSILDELYAIKPNNEQSMLHKFIRFIMRNQKKRSLIVIFTDWAELEEGTDLLTDLIDASKKHLFMFLSVRDPWIREIINKDIDSEDDIYKKVATYKIWQERKALVRKLNQAGINTFDLDPNELTPTLINKYIEIKAMNKI